MDDVDEFEVKIGQREKKDGDTVEYKVTKKNEGSVKRQTNCSKFENTLGLSAAGWDDFIEISHILKLPLSDKPWEASIAVNTLGEETASLVWNNFQLEREAAQETDSLLGGLSMFQEFFRAPEDEAHSLPEGIISEKSPASINVAREEGEDLPGVSSSLAQVQFQVPSNTLAPLVADKKTSPGLSCSFCGAGGILTSFNLRRHIARMHSGSFKCNICIVEFFDTPF